MKKSVLLQRIILLLVLSVTTVVTSCQGFPDSPAGRRGREIFNLFNSTDAESPTDYVRKNFAESFKRSIPEDAWGGGIVQIRNMTGKVELDTVEISSPFELSFIIRSVSNSSKFKIEISVEEKSPWLVEVMRLIPVAPAIRTRRVDPSAQGTVSVSQETIERIKLFLREQAEAGRFSGSVIVAKDGITLFQLSDGLANKRFGSDNRLDTRFNLASLNKSFTAVAILQLVEAGRIGIDDNIGKYLDFFPEEVGRKVTIRQLLNMSNGWGDYWQNEYYLAYKDRLRTVSDYMGFIKDMPLQFEPGTNSIHSNTGFEVAGAVIEKVTGKDYFEYIRENIYAPAGMNHSDSYDRDAPVENLATGYTNYHPLDSKRRGWEWENTYILSPRGTPAGGGYSTVEDLVRYDMALRTGKILGKDYVNFLNSGFRGKIGDPFTPGGTLKSAGGASGASTFLARDLINGFTVVVLTNVDHPVGVEIGEEILKMLGLE